MSDRTFLAHQQGKQMIMVAYRAKGRNYKPRRGRPAGSRGPKFLSANRTAALSSARLLRRELVAGDAPVLLDEAQARALLDTTKGKLDHLIASGGLENMVMSDPEGRRYFQAAAIRRLMLESSRQPARKTSMDRTTYKKLIHVYGAPVGVNDPRRYIDTPNTLSAISDAISEARAAGARTIAEIADALNEAGAAPPNGAARWHQKNTARIIDRLAEVVA